MRSSKKRKLITAIILIFAIPTLIFGIVYLVSSIIYGPTYMNRNIAWGESDIYDYNKFPYRTVKNEPPVFNFNSEYNEELVSSIFNEIEYYYDGNKYKINNLDKFLEDNQTTAFIVIKDDNILYEKYFNGFTRDSINTSFSTAKSFTSALIGIAIHEGYIKSIEEPITNYIPELLTRDKRFEKITIKNLLMMASGIKYEEGKAWMGDDALTYTSPDLRKVAIEKTEIITEPNRYFLYNNFHPLLLGIILERATGVTVAEYMQEKIWKQIGMEFEGSWSLDSKQSGFEKMESGINARSIDFAKFGRLFLNNGSFDGKQIIPAEWVKESTSPPPEQLLKSDFYNNIKQNGSVIQYYKYMWWGFLRDDAGYDFGAAGKYSQIINISPSKNLIIVRNGITDGNVDDWALIFYEFANRI